ncbi:putative protein TPRXL [Pygocentrus nattereri]|uniref:putative protein TPRXL n=1 Tax=Pygocentrus nattereri TaxID=42514 RepID=UPI001891D4FB|nr:putative protein TPRXL [Pygocentrus nattereri]
MQTRDVPWRVVDCESIFTLHACLTLRVFRRLCSQANGSAKAARRNSKHTFLALPASKIPAFCPSSGKSSSASTPFSDASKPTNHLSACSKSSIPYLSLSRAGHSPVPTSNESLRVPGPSQWAKGYGLSLSAQTHGTQSSYYSSSSSSHSSSSSASPTSTSSSSSPSSPSLLSPTTVSRASRAPHVPGFSSPRPQPGTTSSLPIITPASTSKDMA